MFQMDCGTMMTHLLSVAFNDFFEINIESLSYFSLQQSNLLRENVVSPTAVLTTVILPTTV